MSCATCGDYFCYVPWHYNQKSAGFQHNHLPSNYCSANPEYMCNEPSITIPAVPHDVNLQEMTVDKYSYPEPCSQQPFVTKDSGERQQFSTGMQRDTQTNKPRYDLLDMAMLKRWAELMGRGALKYGEHNWKKASTQEELDRFKASFIRHAFQYFNGDTDEDHGAACMFNIAGAEMVKEKLKFTQTDLRQG